MEKIEKQVEQMLDQVRPGIQADGGDVELKSIKDGIVTLKIKGACIGCPMAQLTFNEGVGNMIKEKIKDIKEVNYE